LRLCGSDRCEPLLVSHLGPAVGPCDHQDVWASPLSRSGNAEWARVCGPSGETRGVDFTKEGNCFTQIDDAAGLGRVVDTFSGKPAIGRLNQVCERWLYTCLSLALD